MVVFRLWTRAQTPIHMSDPYAVKWHDISDVERFLAHVKLLTDLGNRQIFCHEYGYTDIEADGFTTGINGTHTATLVLPLTDVHEASSNDNMYRLRRISQRVYELAASMPPPRSIDITTTPTDATFRMYGGRSERKLSGHM